MSDEAWKPIETAPEDRRVLVTNNIKARDARGRMSHVWVGYVHKPYKKSDPDGYITFRENDSRVYALTHWCDIPQAQP